MPNDEKQFDSLPPAIIDALRDLDGPAVLPDDKRDADVLSGARQHLAGAAQIERKRRNLRLFFAGGAGGAIAAAAMVGLVVWLGNPFGDNEPHAEMPAMAMNEEADMTTIPAAPTGDLNASGVVDILDAYTLAKRLEQGNPSQEDDLNLDGQIDQRDIDWIANQVVALNTGERG